jgi:uncharacterized membrane protein
LYKSKLGVRKGIFGVLFCFEMNTKSLVKTAIIAAIYVVLTLAVMPLSYGPIQFRISEALCILPLFFPQSVFGLTIGCLIANLFGNGIFDIVFGTLATALAAVATYVIGRLIKGKARVFVGILPPILFNALIVPFTFLAATELSEAYFLNMLSVGAGEAGVLILLGIPLYFALQHLFSKKPE